MDDKKNIIFKRYNNFSCDSYNNNKRFNQLNKKYEMNNQNNIIFMNNYNCMNNF